MNAFLKRLPHKNLDNRENMYLHYNNYREFILEQEKKFGDESFEKAKKAREKKQELEKGLYAKK